MDCHVHIESQVHSPVYIKAIVEIAELDVQIRVRTEVRFVDLLLKGIKS